MNVPTTKQVRRIIRQTAHDLQVRFVSREDRDTAQTYTDKTNNVYETERQVVFQVEPSQRDRVSQLAHEIAHRMIKQNLQPNFASSELGYIRVYAAIK